MNPEITKRRNFLANRKKAGGSRITIGFTAITDFRSFIGQEYISGISRACEDYDVNFINMSQAIKYSLFDEADFISHYSKKFRFMKAPLLDGLVTWASSLSPYLPNEEIVRRFSRLKPLPMVDIGYLDIPGVTALRIDNSCSMNLVVKHLAKSHGFRKIAFLGSQISRPHTERMISFREAMKKFGLDGENAPVFAASSLDDAEIVRASAELFDFCIKGKDESERIEAVVTSSDIIASRLIQFLQKNGVRVPEDVAVTGFNNQYQGITSSPPITTIDLEYFRRGYMAVEVLINKIMNPEREAEIIEIPTSLTVRESCGCFEKEILEPGESIKSLESEFLPDEASEEDARAFLFERANGIFPKETCERKQEFVDSVFDDLYEETPAKTLCWFREFLCRERGRQFNVTLCQKKVTEIRKSLLVLAGTNEEERHKVENITNSLRILCSVTSDYETKGMRESPYTFNTLAESAIHFASATTGSELKKALKTHLFDLGISGIILSLSENMTRDLETSSVEMILPERGEFEKERLPFRIFDEANFPKSFFPKKERYSFVLEILYYNGRYFGFTFMQMNSKNMALYDSIRLLLCHSLYEIYKKEGRTKEHSMLLAAKNAGGILSLSGKNENPAQTERLSLKTISSYLLEHIGEKTNLDKMSRELGMNKSKLLRETKQATGHTVQALHEKLKIEVAKSLILEGNLTLAEIAERLGFQNGNYFSSVFKKNTGESPKNWLKGVRH